MSATDQNFRRVTRIVQRVQVLLPNATRLLSQIRGRSFSLSRDDLKNLGDSTIDHLPDAIAACLASRAVTIGQIAVALEPLASALMTYALDFAGPAAIAAGVAARHGDDRSIALGHVLSFHGHTFSKWFDVLNSLNLMQLEQGDIPPRTLAALLQPVPLASAAFPVLLEAAGGLNLADLAPLSDRGNNFLLIMEEAPLLMELVERAGSCVSQSYDFHPFYLAELADLHIGPFPNQFIPQVVLPWTMEAVEKICAADAALAASPAAATAHEEERRNRLNADLLCGVYIYIIGQYLQAWRGSEGRAPLGEMLPREVISSRLSNLLAVPNFVPTYLMALERTCMQPLRPDAGVAAALRACVGSFTVNLILMDFKLTKARKVWEQIFWPNMDALLLPETAERLLAVAQSLRNVAAEIGDSEPPHDSRDALRASFMAALLSLKLLTEQNEMNGDGVDAEVALRGLHAMTAAWNSDSKTLQPSDAVRMRQGCFMTAVVFSMVGELNGLRPRVPVVGDAESGAALLKLALKAVEELACMAGSMFVTLQAHVAAEHTGSCADCLAIWTPAVTTAAVTWAANVVWVLNEPNAGNLSVSELEKAAPRALRAAQACLSAARGFASAAPWAAWAAALPSYANEYSVESLKALPSLLVGAVGLLTPILSAAVGPRLAGRESSLSAAALAGLALDIFSTMKILLRCNPDAFSRAQIAALDSFSIVNTQRVAWAPAALVALTASIDGAVGLSGYMPGRDRGLEALLKAAHRCRAVRSPFPNKTQALKVLGEAVAQRTEPDNEIHKSRVSALATLPCACLDCCRTRRPGETRQPSYSCRQCMTARYCSSECQKQAWRDHKIGCQAISGAQGRSSGGGGGSG